MEVKNGDKALSFSNIHWGDYGEKMSYNVEYLP